MNNVFGCEALGLGRANERDDVHKRGLDLCVRCITVLEVEAFTNYFLRASVAPR